MNQSDNYLIDSSIIYSLSSVGCPYYNTVCPYSDMGTE